MTARALRITALCVAILGLGALSSGAATTKSTAKSRTATAKPGARKAVADSNEVLVRFGRDVITRGDVQRRIESLPEQFRGNYTTPEGRQQLLDRMVEEHVWLPKRRNTDWPIVLR